MERCTEQPGAVRLTRRALLTAVGGAAPALGAGASRVRLTGHSRLSPAEFKKHLVGPILTLPTPFTPTYAVDHHAVRRMISLGLQNGVGVFELTAGNSQYDVLSYEEIERLTRTVVEAVGGRGVVIAATGAWWTGEAVKFGRYAAQVGADALQVLLPVGTEDGYVEHFVRLASETGLPLILQGGPSSGVTEHMIERVIRIPEVVAMKEDDSDAFYVSITKRFGKRLAIFCGGQQRRYLLAQPYGSPAFFAFFITFAPQITMRFWEAVKRSDMAAANAIVHTYEDPVFSLCEHGPSSFRAYWRAFLEYFGVATRTVRPPDQGCTDAEMQNIKALCDRLGLFPHR